MRSTVRQESGRAFDTLLYELCENDHPVGYWLWIDRSYSNMTVKEGTKNVISGFDFLMKVVIIGDSGVGKSNLLLRYSEDRFAENYCMTIGINYLYKVEEVEGVRIKLQIWDTAGQDKYKTITQSYYNGANGVIVAYQVDSRLSFLAVKNWVMELREKARPTSQLLLIANKIDVPQEQRQVTRQEGEQLAKALDIPFFQCSAKTGENIQKAFYCLAGNLKRNIIDLQSNRPETPGRKVSHSGNQGFVSGKKAFLLGKPGENNTFKYEINERARGRQKCSC